MVETGINLASGGSFAFRILALLIFALAITHTLLANHFTVFAEHLSTKYLQKKRNPKSAHILSFVIEMLRFLGEVEVIFALWTIPLLVVIITLYDWNTALEYLNSRSYIEPLFVVVVMSLVATRPILTIAEGGLWLISNFFGGSLSAWWLTILTLGPILGSFITEVGAMTICALLLMKKFYAYSPAKSFAYATLGLLFVNISVGGLLTSFASPPVLIVSRLWQWDSATVFLLFGWKALLGIFLATTCYFLYFRKEFKTLEAVKREKDLEGVVDQVKPVPLWIIIIHICFVAWVVINSHHPVIFIGGFLLFLGFHQATAPHQSALQLKRPLLVGMFLAGLLIHGGLQQWWIEPMLGKLGFTAMMLVGLVLTPFNDNAAITYLATLIPNLNANLKYAIMAGVIAGGGLTVIANAPNPAGQIILKKFFRKGISPLYLFLGALLPTLIMFALFYFLSSNTDVAAPPTTSGSL